jgi:threonyl-tRNA synthetase
LWLTPEQVRILPVSEKFNEYSRTVATKLNSYDIRALVDERNEKVGKKIREAELEKVPYMLIVGDEEMQAGSVSARKKGEGDIGAMSVDDFASKVNAEVAMMLAGEI